MSGAEPAHKKHKGMQGGPSYDIDLADESDGGSDDVFEYESDVDEDQQGDQEQNSGVRAQGGDDDGRDPDTIVISSDIDVDVELQSQTPPEPSPAKNKGKLTSRKQFQIDCESAKAKWGGARDKTVTNLGRDDESVRFTLHLPNSPDGQTGAVSVVLVFPELGGYPKNHSVMACSEDAEVAPEVDAVMAGVAALPSRADRSVTGLVDYMVLRLVKKEPSPSGMPEQSQETDDDMVYDDDQDEMFQVPVGMTSATRDALRADFKQLLAAGYRPGLTQISELDKVVSVSKRVSTFGVPPQALQAWDSRLMTGETVYLVLLMYFRASYPVDPDNMRRGEPEFKLGISPRYKPSRAALVKAFRGFSTEVYTPGEFEAISLTVPFEALLRDTFQRVLSTRRSNAKCGWAAAETYVLSPELAAKPYSSKACSHADKAEAKLAVTYSLPSDPLADTATANNLPLLAMSYLHRRFVMCPRFCLICFKDVSQSITALKPFVCDSQLCLFQFISLGLGPSLEHEIKTNAPSVDLLIQLTYIAASEQRLQYEQQPHGIGLKIPKGSLANPSDDEIDFDQLDGKAVMQRNRAVVILIDQLPPVAEMRDWLMGVSMSDEDKMLGRGRKLTQLNPNKVSPSAWALLRWIVASNTSYLK